MFRLDSSEGAIVSIVPVGDILVQTLSNMFLSLILLLAAAPAAADPLVSGARPSPAEIKSEGSTPEADSTESTSELISIETDWNAAREASEKLDFSAAQERLEAALAVQSRLFGDSDFTTAALLLDLAMVLAYQEDFEGADAIVRRAGPIIDRSPRPTDRARFAGYQATIAMLQGDYSVAARFAQDASSKWREIIGSDDQQALLSLFQTEEEARVGVQPELALSLAREAAILLRLDDPVTAYAKAGEALFEFNSAAQKPPIWRAEILGVLGEASSALGRLSAADTFFKAAIAIRRSVQGDGPGMIRLLLAQGRAYQREAMNVNSIIAFRRAVEIAKNMPPGSVALRVDDLVPFAAAVLDEEQFLESEEDRLGLMTELYDAFQIAFVPGRDDVINLASMQFVDDDPVLSDLIDNLKQSLLLQAEINGKLGVERAKVTGDRDDGLIEFLLSQLQIQSDKVSGIRDILNQEYPDYQRFDGSELPDLNVVRGALAPDEALASFLIGQDSSFLQLITRDRVHIAPIEAGNDKLDQMVRELRQGLEIENGSVNEFNLDESHFLYQTLFGAVADELNKLGRLIVIPNGPLSDLPFGTLVTRLPLSADYTEASWLVNQMSVTHAPSLVSFINLRSTRTVRAPPRSFLGVANPKFVSDIQTLPSSEDPICNPEGLAILSRFDSLEELPDTIDEVNSVIASLGIEDADVFSDRAAKEEVFRTDSLNQYNIIYVATHAVMPGEVACQREPGIALARPGEMALSRTEDGFLDASEIAALRISANLVVLSACNTATSSDAAVQKGESLSGLAESFFIAGARSMLVTHWQVPSVATATLMKNLFGNIGDERGLSTDQALQRAQVEAISNEETAHPFFWGAFSFVGSGAETVFTSGSKL